MTLYSCALRPQRGQDAVATEGRPAQPNAGGVVDRIGDRSDQRLVAAFTRPVRRQIGPARIGIPLTSTTSMDSGVSECRRLGYEAQLTLVTFSVSNWTSSQSARLKPCNMPHSTV